MILANVAAAETLEKKATPLIYRVHDEPGREKARCAARIPADARYLVSEDRRTASRNLQSHAARGEGPRLRAAGERNRAALAGAGRVCGGELRSLRPEPAPLRALHLADPPLRGPRRAPRAGARARPWRGRIAGDSRPSKRLSETAANISATERRAMKAERETADRLIAHFLADRVGATFRGRVSGVTRAGLFVKLDDTGADGLVPSARSAASISSTTRPATRSSARAAEPCTGWATPLKFVWSKPHLSLAHCGSNSYLKDSRQPRASAASFAHATIRDPDRTAPSARSSRKSGAKKSPESRRCRS